MDISLEPTKKKANTGWYHHHRHNFHSFLRKKNVLFNVGVVTKTGICMLKILLSRQYRRTNCLQMKIWENLDSTSEQYFWVLCHAWNSVLRMFNSRYKRTSRKTWKDSLKFFQSCWTFCLLKDYAGFLA